VDNENKYREDFRSPKNEQKLMDQRSSKINLSTDIYGKPEVLIRNNPQFQS
jgi:hypothetical protein